MHTRCPACQEVFELKAHHLSQAGGVVRCGGCRETFNALAHLFDDQRVAESGSAPLEAGGMPPELPAPAQANLRLADEDPEGAAPDEPDPAPDEIAKSSPRSARSTYLWPALAVGLALAAGLQWLTMDKAQRQTLFNLAGGLNGPDPAIALAVTSRGLHPHPSVAGAVVLNATVTNRADQALPLPVLEVRLLDHNQDLVGVRRFSPHQYRSVSDTTTLAPNVSFTVVFDLVPAGAAPQDFEIRFL